jgi:hypothetical protein
MPQEKPNNEANQKQSQGEGQPQKSGEGAQQNAQNDKLHAADDEEAVRSYGEPTDGSGGGGDQIGGGDQVSTVP